MKEIKKYAVSPAGLTGAALSLVMVMMLCFPKLSLDGARNGLMLWYQTVLPTLLPFMVCTNLIISMNAIKFLTAPAALVLKKLFHLSDSGCFILLCGMLCGYPMGAKCCSDFLDQQCLSPAEARSLYAVSSLPSPMFLAGYMMAKAAQAAGNTQLPELWKMAAAIYLPVLPMFFLAAGIYHFYGAGKSDTSLGHSVKEQHLQTDSKLPLLPLDEALASSTAVMVKIGGYLMLFSILARFIRLLSLPVSLRCFLICATEMTTGMEETARWAPGFLGILYILAAGAFGGFSGIFQVKSVTKNAGLSIWHYVLWKAVHSLSACLVLIALKAV